MRDCPPSVRAEIEDLFEGVLDSASGAILYQVVPSRVIYLSKWARYIKDQAAYESTEAFPPHHPKYGIGIYSDIHFVASEKGLYIYKKDAIELTNSQILLNAAFRNKEVVVTFKSVEQARKFENLLNTKRQKIVKRWPNEAFSSIIIVSEENRVIVRTTGSVKSRMSETSLAEIEALLMKGESPADSPESPEPPGAFDDDPD